MAVRDQPPPPLSSHPCQLRLAQCLTTPDLSKQQRLLVPSTCVQIRPRDERLDPQGDSWPDHKLTSLIPLPSTALTQLGQDPASSSLHLGLGHVSSEKPKCPFLPL